jgi:hypothetical protein
MSFNLFKRLRGQPEAPAEVIPADLAPADVAIIKRVRPYTMTSAERIAALLGGVDHVVRRGLPGAFAECGVWRGGSVLAMALRLIELGDTSRDLYLFDTFEGMTAPTEHDQSRYDGSALKTWQQAEGAGEKAWENMFNPSVFGQEQVRQVLLASGYPEQRIHLVPGTVETTIPQQAPPQLALLRLDTDWYESTRHEMQHLYPRLVQGGVLIIDDYGHWDGCRKAVDEYFASGVTPPLLLARVDYTGRIAIKG